MRVRTVRPETQRSAEIVLRLISALTTDGRTDGRTGQNRCVSDPGGGRTVLLRSGPSFSQNPSHDNAQACSNSIFQSSWLKLREIPRRVNSELFGIHHLGLEIRFIQFPRGIPRGDIPLEMQPADCFQKQNQNCFLNQIHLYLGIWQLTRKLRETLVQVRRLSAATSDEGNENNQKSTLEYQPSICDAAPRRAAPS